MHLKSYMAYAVLFLATSVSFAQGPPITTDKPIMLGEHRKILKTLTELRFSPERTITKIPVMAHYLPTSNSLVAIHLPYVSRSDESSGKLGDIQLLGKYQFYRKDQTGKTFRVVAKALQTFPTGPRWNIDGISASSGQTFAGIVAGYESIKLGISNEVGYNLEYNGTGNELVYKLGVGLPLLKPTYPAKQVNLYFEYTSKWFVQRKNYLLLYAQGVQYAIGRFTIESAVQFPLIQDVNPLNERTMSLFLGTRYIF